MKVVRYHAGDAYRVYLIKQAKKWTQAVCFDASNIRVREVLTKDIDETARSVGHSPADFARSCLDRIEQYEIPCTQAAMTILSEALKIKTS